MTERRIFAPHARPLWRRPWVVGAAAVLAVMLGNAGFRKLVSRWREVRRLRAELADLKAEETRLQEKIAVSGKAGPSLERSARSTLGYLKPGEVEYRFPPPKKDKQAK